MKNVNEKIFIIYHYVSGDGGSLIETYKPENIGEAEIFIKAIIKDEDLGLDYVIVGKDFTEQLLLGVEKQIFRYVTIFGDTLTI